MKSEDKRQFSQYTLLASAISLIIVLLFVAYSTSVYGVLTTWKDLIGEDAILLKSGTTNDHLFAIFYAPSNHIGICVHSMDRTLPSLRGALSIYDNTGTDLLVPPIKDLKVLRRFGSMGMLIGYPSEVCVFTVNPDIFSGRIRVVYKRPILSEENKSRVFTLGRSDEDSIIDVNVQLHKGD